MDLPNLIRRTCHRPRSPFRAPCRAHRGEGATGGDAASDPAPEVTSPRREAVSRIVPHAWRRSGGERRCPLEPLPFPRPANGPWPWSPRSKQRWPPGEGCDRASRPPSGNRRGDRPERARAAFQVGDQGAHTETSAADISSAPMPIRAARLQRSTKVKPAQIPNIPPIRCAAFPKFTTTVGAYRVSLEP